MAMDSSNNASNTLCVKRTSIDILTPIYITTFVLGLMFHLATIGPIIRQICRKNVLGIFLLSLCVSDLMYILTMPLWIHYFRNDHMWNLGPSMCSLVGFVYYSNLYISIYLLCCISVDRCLVITFPLRVRAFRRQRYAWSACALVYISVTTMHIVVLGLDKLPDSPDASKRCYETFPMTERIALFNLIRVAVGFIVPLVVITVCYWLIPTKIQQSRGVGEQGKRKIKLLSVAVIVIFSFCFAPYHILLLMRSIVFFSVGDKGSCKYEQDLYLPFTCSLALSSLNSVVDPVLYVLASNGGREELSTCCVKKPSAERSLAEFYCRPVLSSNQNEIQ